MVERILFSPLGDTDPIRGCHDGAMLHILRHYRPTRVVLFYTYDMAEKERRDHRYTRAIKHVAPDCIVEEQYTDIQDAHLYETFSKILPQEVLRLREEHPTCELLLNLSSGTPQMKTVLSIMAAHTSGCRAVQVPMPEGKSNRSNEATKDTDNIDVLIETNIDDEEDAKNRCVEPPLYVFHFYEERSRILSLIDSYEYAAALKVARGSVLIPQEATSLLQYAERRSMLLTEEAKKVLREYDGKKLFPFTGKTEALVEYFLIMQIDQETGRLSNLMLRMIPFLYEFLREYVVQNVKIPIHMLCERRKNAPWLVREKLEKQEKELLTHLDRVFTGGYKDQALSFYILYHCCSYAGKTGRTGDSVRHAGMMAELEQIKEVRNLRNETAHEMVNVTEKRFHEAVGIGSQEAMGCFCRMLVLIYGDKVRTMRSIYRDLNAWVEQALEVHA